MTTVVVHVGPPKTGTTAIQAFLHRNSVELLRSGVLYPQAGRLAAGESMFVMRPDGRTLRRGPATAHHLLPWSLLGETEGLEPDRCWADLRDEIEHSSAPLAVISSEAFARLRREHVAAVRRFLDGCDVAVVAYFRDPVARILSDYTQRVKSGRVEQHFAEFIESEAELIRDYDRFLDLWDAAYGVENVIVRDFGKANETPGLELDFLAVLGRGMEIRDETQSGQRLNASPSNASVRWLRGINRLERMLGRPGATRRGFAGLRKLVSQPIPARIAGRLSGSGALCTRDDEKLIREMAADRCSELADRCAASSGRSLTPESIGGG